MLIIPNRQTILYFGIRISARIVNRWAGQNKKKMLINQAELFPALLARTTWSSHLRERKCIHFVDNDGCRDALIKGYSPVECSGHLLGAVWSVDEALQMYSWFCRVPSESNVADGPSRLDFQNLEALGATRCEVVFPDNWDVVGPQPPSFPIIWREAFAP